MVTKALKIALCVALSGTAVFASESGKLAARAQKSFKAGNFSKGYSQLDRALVASRKEADLNAESRILIAMGQVRTMSLDFDMADSLFSHVSNNVGKTTRTMLIKAKIGLKNATEKFSEAVSLCEGINKDDLDGIADELQGAFYSECAIAYAGSHRDEKAKEALKMVDKRLDDDTGIYYWTEGRLADLLNQGDANEIYLKAEKESVKANMPYTTANILYHRAKYLSKSNPSKSKELLDRCKTAFELMGLLKNSARCAE